MSRKEISLIISNTDDRKNIRTRKPKRPGFRIGELLIHLITAVLAALFLHACFG